MFSITKRVNSITVSEKHWEEINSLLSSVQQKHNVEFKSIKDCFEFLLNHANAEIEPIEIEPKTVEILPENALILDENTEIASKCTTLLQEFANAHEIGDSSPAIQILRAVELSNSEPKTVEIEKTVEVPLQIGENQLLVDLNPNQKKVLELTVENRKKHHERKGVDKTETPSTILRDRFFRWDVLENWTSEFYTGLRRK